MVATKGDAALVAALDRLALTVRGQRQSLAEQYSDLRGDVQSLQHHHTPAAEGKSAVELAESEAKARRLAERRLRDMEGKFHIDEQLRGDQTEELAETRAELERVKVDAAEEVRRASFQLRRAEEELADAKALSEAQADELVRHKQLEDELRRAIQRQVDEVESLQDQMQFLRDDLEERKEEVLNLHAELDGARNISHSRDVDEASEASGTTNASSAAGEGKPKRKSKLSALFGRRGSKSSSASKAASSASSAGGSSSVPTSTAAAFAAADAARVDTLMTKLEAEPGFEHTMRADAAAALAEHQQHVGKAFNALLERGPPTPHDQTGTISSNAPAAASAPAAAAGKTTSKWGFGKKKKG